MVSTVYGGDIDRIYRDNGLGELSSVIRNNFYGINHRGTGSPIPLNNEQYGLTFFTRPRLNLSYDNVQIDRLMYPLLSEDARSLWRAFRVYLDPITAGGGFEGNEPPLESLLVDNQMAFIPLLTNNLISLQGWPDVALDTYTSKEGVARESWTMADGPSKVRSVFQLQASFRNVIGDPILHMFHMWITYMSNVYQGHMVPWPDEVIANSIDYQTRIYRLILDPSRRYVRKIANTIASFPVSCPLGTFADYTNETPFNRENDQISITFQCVGAEYMDPISIIEFNDTVRIFNRDLIDSKIIESRYVKVPANMLGPANSKGYPLIDPVTYELNWYLKKEDYEAILP